MLKDEQNGYRINRCCQDLSSSLYYLPENRTVNKLDTYCCCMDFKKAFDSISREFLWHKLANYGINSQILGCLQATYTNVTSSLKIINKMSTPFEINCGLKQGCALSSTFFNIFINDLIGYRNQADEGITFRDCKVML